MDADDGEIDMETALAEDFDDIESETVAATETVTSRPPAPPVVRQLITPCHVAYQRTESMFLSTQMLQLLTHLATL